MSEWKRATLADNEAINGVAGAVSNAGNTVKAALAVYQAIMGKLTAIVEVLPPTDDMSAPIQQLINSLSDLFNTGIYFYSDAGSLVSGAEPDGVQGFLNRWEKSFDDIGDKYRPQFSDDADIAASIVLVGANNLPSLTPLLSSLIAFFEMERLKEFEGKDMSLNWFDQVESAMSTPPDWASVKLKQVIPIYSELVQLLEETSSVMASASGMADQFQHVMQAVDNKIKKLGKVAEDAGQLAEQLAAISGSGFYVLDLESTSGVKGLIASAKDADISPLELQSDSFVVGLCMLSGTIDKQQFITARDQLWSIL